MSLSTLGLPSALLLCSAFSPHWLSLTRTEMIFFLKSPVNSSAVFLSGYKRVCII